MKREELQYKRELENIKMAVLKKGTHGQNNLKRRTWTQTDFSNEKRVNTFCKMAYRYLKFFPEGWIQCNLKNKRSMCSRAMAKVTVSQQGDNQGGYGE